jgi:hypothetical protein
MPYALTADINLLLILQKLVRVLIRYFPFECQLIIMDRKELHSLCGVVVFCLMTFLFPQFDLTYYKGRAILNQYEPTTCTVDP